MQNICLITIHRFKHFFMPIMLHFVNLYGTIHYRLQYLVKAATGFASFLLVYHSKNECNSQYLWTKSIHFMQVYGERVRG